MTKNNILDENIYYLTEKFQFLPKLTYLNSINYINNSFISNSSNNSVYLNEIINYNSQSIKNDNMIFMTDSELFTEKTDKKINLVKQKNITKTI